MHTLDIIIFIVALILLGLAGAFAAASSSYMAKNLQIGRNAKAAKARSTMTWSSVISFIGIFLLLIAIVLFFVYGNTADAGSRKLIVGVIIILTLILIIISGVLAIVGVSGFKSSGVYTGVGTDSTAYNLGIAAAVLLLGGLVILFLVWLFVLFLRKPQRLERVYSSLPTSVQQKISALLGESQPISTTTTSTSTSTTISTPTPTPTPTPRPVPPRPSGPPPKISADQLVPGVTEQQAQVAKALVKSKH